MGRRDRKANHLFSLSVALEVFNTHNCMFLSGVLVYFAAERRMIIDTQKFCTILDVTLRQNTVGPDN